SWTAMKFGPRMFQCACLMARARSIPSARRAFSTSTDVDLAFSLRSFVVLWVNPSTFFADFLTSCSWALICADSLYVYGATIQKMPRLLYVHGRKSGAIHLVA